MKNYCTFLTCACVTFHLETTRLFTCACVTLKLWHILFRNNQIIHMCLCYAKIVAHLVQKQLFTCACVTLKLWHISFRNQIVHMYLCHAKIVAYFIQTKLDYSHVPVSRYNCGTFRLETTGLFTCACVTLKLWHISFRNNQIVYMCLCHAKIVAHFIQKQLDYSHVPVPR